MELAASAGLRLDPWQVLVLEHGLGERANGKWAAFEVACLVSRQNGKGAILEALELAALYLFGERLVLHSAHEFKTCVEAFRRVLSLIEGNDSLKRRVKKVRTSHGEEGIELTTGQRLRFIARSTGSGRGFSGDRVILDEAQHLGDEQIEALLPTMSAKPNPQLWYTATAGDMDVAPCGPLARVRQRGIRGNDSSLCYLEWSIDAHDDFCPTGCTVHDNPGDVRSWARANPGLGHRISVEHVAREYASMGPAGFARERLGVGNWPSAEGRWAVITEPQWAALVDPASQPTDPVAFAADVTPDRQFGSIAVAGRRDDGLIHVELVARNAGTAWMVEDLIKLVGKWHPCAVVVDGAGAAGSLIAPLDAAGITVIKPTMREVTQSCGAFWEAAVDAKTLRHLNQGELAAALGGAKKRKLGDSWAWSRTEAGVDISPLVACTLALWGLVTHGHAVAEPQPFFAAWR